MVFKYPHNTRVDYIKRVIGLPGDHVAYRNKQLFIKPACAGDDCPDFTPVELSEQRPGGFFQGYELERLTENLAATPHDIFRSLPVRSLEERYYSQPGVPRNEWVVPDGHYFTMGDNRDASEDSRFWGFVPAENLVGRAVAIWVSFEFERNADSWLPGWVPSDVRFSRIGAIH